MMNNGLDTNENKLKALFTIADDQAGAHCLWIDATGKVHLDLIPARLPIREFQRSRPTMAVCYVPFPQGGNYVGLSAANDRLYITNTLRHLNQVWSLRKEGSVILTDGSEY